MLDIMHKSVNRPITAQAIFSFVSWMLSHCDINSYFLFEEQVYLVCGSVVSRIMF